MITASFQLFNFTETDLWLKVEGIQVELCFIRFVEQLLGKVGKVMRFDDSSSSPGPKIYYRALVWVKLKSSLVPRAFIDVQKGKTL